MKTLTFTISPKGEITLAVSGIKGSSCHDATREIETALGVVTSTEATSEAYETASLLGEQEIGK